MKKTERDSEVRKWRHSVLTTDFRNGDIGGSEQQGGVGGEGHRFTGEQIYFKVGDILAFLYADRKVLLDRGNVEILKRVDDGKSKAFE